MCTSERSFFETSPTCAALRPAAPCPAPHHPCSKADVNADKGLTADEAKRRLIANGANVLPEGKQKTLLERIWAQLSNVSTCVPAGGPLLATASISGPARTMHPAPF